MFASRLSSYCSSTRHACFVRKRKVLHMDKQKCYVLTPLSTREEESFSFHFFFLFKNVSLCLLLGRNDVFGRIPKDRAVVCV